MLRKNPVTYKDFWQPFIITYSITVAVVATCILQYNITELASNLFFYRVECKNYLIFTLAKVAESLTPTTITFVLTLLLAEYIQYKKKQITKIVVSTVMLSIMGMLFPTMKSDMGFWIILILIYMTIAISITFIKEEDVNIFLFQNHKSEKSDGKYSN